MSAGSPHTCPQDQEGRCPGCPGFIIQRSQLCPVAQGCLDLPDWLHTKGLLWSHHWGDFHPRGTQLGGHKGGRGLTSQNQEGRGQVHLNAIPALVPSRSWTHPDVAGTALSAHGLSEGNLLSWTGPPAPAELAMEPKDKVMSPFQKAYLLGESSHCTQLSAGKRSLQQAPLSCL